MIAELRRQTEIDRKSLAVCHYGRKILCNMVAYGTKYSFCRFFRLRSHDKTAWMMLQNSTLLVSTQADFSNDAEAHAELSLFVEMHQPFRVEGAQSLLSGLQLKGYQQLHRSVFRLEPGGISPVFDPDQVDNVTAATAIYDYGDQVLIGQVATKVAARGKGYARDFLHWIANDLEARGKTGILYALDIRKSFYEEIGFTLIESEFVWERLHAAEPDGGKGIL